MRTLFAKVKKGVSEFWVDEAGQSTTEYILILVVVVMVALRFKSSFSGIMTNQVGQLEGKLNEAFQD